MSFAGFQGDVWLLAALASLGEHRQFRGLRLQGLRGLGFRGDWLGGPGLRGLGFRGLEDFPKSGVPFWESPL